MRIIEVIIEAVDPTGANITAEDNIEGLSKGERDNKIIIEANTKATVDNLTLLVVAITIIMMAIIEVEVAMAVVVAFIDHVVTEEAITEAITITNTINITCMMMDLSLNNMVHHALFAEVSIILKHCFKGEHDINNLMEKMSLGSNNQHQNDLYQ